MFIIPGKEITLQYLNSTRIRSPFPKHYILFLIREIVKNHLFGRHLMRKISIGNNKNFRPVLNVLSFKFWEFPEVNGLRKAVKQKMCSAVHSAINQWIVDEVSPFAGMRNTRRTSHDSFTNTTVDLSELCELMGNLTFFLRRFGEKYETFFELFSFSYLDEVMKSVDDSVNRYSYFYKYSY